MCVERLRTCNVTDETMYDIQQHNQPFALLRRQPLILLHRKVVQQCARKPAAHGKAWHREFRWPCASRHISFICMSRSSLAGNARLTDRGSPMPLDFDCVTHQPSASQLSNIPHHVHCLPDSRVQLMTRLMTSHHASSPLSSPVAPVKMSMQNLPPLPAIVPNISGAAKTPGYKSAAS